MDDNTYLVKSVYPTVFNVSSFLCFSVLCVLCLCTRLFICALWSPAGKGLTSWLSFVVSNCEICHFPIGILGQVWYLIVSIPDLCFLNYFLILCMNIAYILKMCMKKIYIENNVFYTNLQHFNLANFRPLHILVMDNSTYFGETTSPTAFNISFNTLHACYILSSGLDNSCIQISNYTTI